ncbi:class II aldolase/adducin N-terminal [Lentinula raphanica]|nr:class II aldolase/adducin N-terminal [Lentinula raphanica]KAJ3774588.1 class II aldolase/adducin N-terminal [Lentinula raphanica]KAJ3818718.1 class II aldolase/adducin N-terminal [Lentinula raphanica]
MNGHSVNGKYHQTLDGLAENPLRRTWRGDKQGKIELGTVPKFDNPYEEREWIKEHMAAAFRYWGKCGYGEGVSGHITVRDPVLPDHYWMNPFAEHFSTMTKSMLVLVGPDGHVSPHGAQLPINSSGFYIHSAIHKARPDVKAAAHCHSLHGKTWSAFGRPIDILTQDSCLFYDNLGVYQNFGGVVLAEEEGKNIAEALGPKWKACILQNHGLLTLGNTVDEAVFLFGALDRLCHAQLLAEAAEANGLRKSVISKEDAEFTSKTIQWWENVYVNFQPEYKLLLQETKGAFLL